MGKKSYVWDGTAWVVFTGTTTYPVADTSGTQGVVSLVDSTSSTSTTTAAVPASVKSSYDLAAAAIPKSTVTTAGDVIYATGSSAVTRLALGTAGKVLTVNAGATAPEWATPAGGGGMTLIATATPSAATTLSFTSIPTTYKHLVIEWAGVFQSVTNVGWSARFNSDSGSNYGYRAIRTSTGTATANGQNAIATVGDAAAGSPVIPSSGTAAGSFDNSTGSFVIYRYTDLATRQFAWHSTGTEVGAGAPNRSVIGRGLYISSGSAITSIEFIRESTQTITGTFYLYGVS